MFSFMNCLSRKTRDFSYSMVLPLFLLKSGLFSDSFGLFSFLLFDTLSLLSLCFDSSYLSKFVLLVFISKFLSLDSGNIGKSVLLVLVRKFFSLNSRDLCNLVLLLLVGKSFSLNSRHLSQLVLLLFISKSLGLYSRYFG
jgi:hypothetical protein